MKEYVYAPNSPVLVFCLAISSKVDGGPDFARVGASLTGSFSEMPTVRPTVLSSLTRC